MKLPLSLPGLPVVLLLLVAGPALCAGSYAPKTYPATLGPYAGHPDDWDASASYRDRTRSVAGQRQGGSLDEDPEWVAGPVHFPPSGASWPSQGSGQFGDGGYRPNQTPYDRAPYMTTDDELPQAGEVWSSRDRSLSGMPGDLPSSAVRGYRFRGDDPESSGRRGLETRKYGYQFRPLTNQERQRMDSVTGWRPQAPERAGDRPGRRNALPASEVFGYQPENWFKRYYGERR